MSLIREKDGKRLHIKSRLMGESLVGRSFMNGLEKPRRLFPGNILKSEASRFPTAEQTPCQDHRGIGGTRNTTGCSRPGAAPKGISIRSGWAGHAHRSHGQVRQRDIRTERYTRGPRCSRLTAGYSSTEQISWAERYHDQGSIPLIAAMPPRLLLVPSERPHPATPDRFGHYRRPDRRREYPDQDEKGLIPTTPRKTRLRVHPAYRWPISGSTGQ